MAFCVYVDLLGNIHKDIMEQPSGSLGIDDNKLQCVADTTTRSVQDREVENQPNAWQNAQSTSQSA